jgi:hypothetical protein
MSADVRDELGRFTSGNPGGPGRPRRTIEREYMAALGDAITLDDWREVVARAVADAKAGDQGARNWLAKYLLGSAPRTLADIATDEARSWTVEDEILLGPRDKFKADASDIDDDDDWV